MHLLFVLLLFSVGVFGRPPLEYPDNPSPPGVDTWCGKAYRATDEPFDDLVRAGWTSPSPAPDRGVGRLELRCWPRYKPVISNGQNISEILVSARVTYGKDYPFDYLPPLDRVLITITEKTTNQTLAEDYFVPIDDSPEWDVNSEAGAVRVPVDLAQLKPRTAEYELSCAAAIPNYIPKRWKQTFEIPDPAHADLFYLPPNPYGGTTVILDQRYRELLVENLPKGSKLPRQLYPVGWYTNWGDYLAHDHNILRKMKMAGFTIVHPVPGGGPASSAWLPSTLENFTQLLDSAADAGIYVMYDTRHTYLSPSDLAAQIKLFRSHPALLLWYSSDEPDGPGHSASSPGSHTDSVVKAYDLINELDGYHPVSITPNCANYFLPQYASGADIIIPDVYPIGLNSTSWSSVYKTPCNVTYGCCGCDLCNGEVEDVGRRIQNLKSILRWKGMRKEFWGVVQAFGGEGEFWERMPRKEEVIKMGEQVAREGGRGILFWDEKGRKGRMWKGVWDGAKEVAKKGRDGWGYNEIDAEMGLGEDILSLRDEL